MKQLLHNLWEKLRIQLGRAPDCDWVQARLGAFCDWDLRRREFAAIEEHISACPECAKECAEIRAITHAFRAASPIAGLGELNREASAATIAARINAYEAARPAQHAPNEELFPETWSKQCIIGGRAVTYK